MVKKATPPSPKLKNTINAFLIGGLICALAQCMLEIYLMLGINSETAKLCATVSLIFLTALLTGMGVFDDIAKVAGAGTLVPITGFANAVSSPAVEFKSEGYVLGVGANMFKIAGPVIVYGTIASVIYGVIYWVMRMV